MCHFSDSRDVWTEIDEAETDEAETDTEDSHPALEAERDVEVDLLTDGGDED